MIKFALWYLRDLLEKPFIWMLIGLSFLSCYLASKFKKKGNDIDKEDETLERGDV